MPFNLEFKKVTKIFKLRKGFFKVKEIKALDNVSFSISSGEFFSLVGETGSGKTTAGRIVLRLLKPDSGQVLWNDKDIFKMKKSELKEYRRKVQVVFQNPYTSFNPLMKIGEIIEEPLIIHKMGDKQSRLKRVKEVLDLVKLPESFINRYPDQLSGGQRQRVAIARAVAVNPELIVADEPVSALDVSIQAQIVNLFLKLHKEMGLTFLFIAHDLNLVKHLSDKVAVLYKGKIVDYGETEKVFSSPTHPFTRELLESVPPIDF